MIIKQHLLPCVAFPDRSFPSVQYVQLIGWLIRWLVGWSVSWSFKLVGWLVKLVKLVMLVKLVG